MGATGTEPTRDALIGAVLFVQSLKGLSHLERSVLLTVIAIYRARAPCALSVDKWATRLGVHRASMYRALKKLNGRYLRRISRHGKTSLFSPAPFLCSILERGAIATSGAASRRGQAGQVDHRAMRGVRHASPHHGRSVPPHPSPPVPRSLDRAPAKGDGVDLPANRGTEELSEVQRFIIALGQKNSDGGSE